MNTAIAWFLGFTKLGKIVDPVRSFISGKGSYLAGAALALPALITILQKFAEQGMPYLLGVVHTPEWAALMGGIAVIRIRGAITKSADPSKDPNVTKIEPPSI